MYPHHNIPKKSQSYTASIQSPKFHLDVINSKNLKYCLSQVQDRTLDMIISDANFLSIYGLVKLENKLSVPKIQWWDHHRLPDTDIPIQKGRKWMEKSITGPRQFCNPAGEMLLVFKSYK